MFRPTLAALLLLIAPAAAQAEKLYAGRPLAEWQERIKALHPASTEAVQAIPGLAALLDDPQVPWFTRKQAALTLGRVGGAGQGGVSAQCLPPLTRLLSQAEGGAEAPRCWGAKGLALLGRKAGPAGAELAKILRDPMQPLVHRLAVLEPLAAIGPAHPDAIPALVELLQTPLTATGDAAELREIALEAVVILGPAGEVAVPLAMRMLRDPRESEAVRRKAAAALGAIGPRAEPAAVALGETVLADPSPQVRDVAAEALGKLGERAVPLVAALIEHRDPAARARGALAAAKLGVTGKPLVPSLAKHLADAAPLVRLRCAEAIYAIDPNHAQLVPAAVALLASDDREQRAAAMKLLDRLGPRVASGREQLTRLLSDPRDGVRRSAERLLERLP